MANFYENEQVPLVLEFHQIFVKVDHEGISDV